MQTTTPPSLTCACWYIAQNVVMRRMRVGQVRHNTASQHSGKLIRAAVSGTSFCAVNGSNIEETAYQGGISLPLFWLLMERKPSLRAFQHCERKIAP